MRRGSLVLLSSLLCCYETRGSEESGAASQGGASMGTDTSGSTATASEGEADTSAADSTGAQEPRLDVGSPDSGGPPGTACVPIGKMQVSPCTQKAPPDSFDPEVQWSWDGDDGIRGSAVTPLVANLTDDNDDGVVDLCDIPDVVLVVNPGIVVALSGSDGAEHWRSPYGVTEGTTPALGDIDGDGHVEIVSTAGDSLVALDHEGNLEWSEPIPSLLPGFVHAVALADIDNDGDVEIVVNNAVFDHEGRQLWSVAPGGEDGDAWSATAIADLDDDDDMEIIIGGAAYHHDGSLYFENPGLQWRVDGLFAAVANLDGDDDAEILFSAHDGFALVEHDGTMTWSQFQMTEDSGRPTNIHDFDGDGEAEFAAALPSLYGVYELDRTTRWTAEVRDSSGQSGGSGFDFLGIGRAQAVYADETQFFAFDDAGNELMAVPRSSITQIEYPVVVDVDNDGSAEVLVVSNGDPEQTAPTLQVIRDREDRWIPARRIWNQHTYHVTNVREDGSIPQVEPKHWRQLNTYRTQAQIEAGGVCQPPPAG